MIPAFISKYDDVRERIWPEIEAFFQGLPPSFRKMGWAFARRLALQTSKSHAFKDAFTHPFLCRIVYLPLWQIDMYIKRGVSIRDAKALQSELFIGAFLKQASATQS